jgi:hypothetical protein
MFERFKKTRPADQADGTGRTAVADRPVEDRPAATSANDRLATEPAPEQRASLADRETRDDHDHSTRNAALAGGAGVAAGEVAGRHHERKREREIASEESATGVQPATRREATAPRTRAGSPVLEAEGLATMRDRQRARYGGMSWGAAFFGLLCAVGLAAILTSILAAAGAAIGLNELKNTANAGNKTLSLGGGILLLVVLAIAWYCGGYVAGRMARFDGARQGVGVWIWTILFVALVTIAAIIGGSQYDVAGRLNLPSVPTNDQTYATGGLIAAIAAALVTLLFAILGGKAGDLFHRRVDRVATDHYDDEVVA